MLSLDTQINSELATVRAHSASINGLRQRAQPSSTHSAEQANRQADNRQAGHNSLQELKHKRTYRRAFPQDCHHGKTIMKRSRTKPRTVTESSVQPSGEHVRPFGHVQRVLVETRSLGLLVVRVSDPGTDEPEYSCRNRRGEFPDGGFRMLRVQYLLLNEFAEVEFGLHINAATKEN
ncbi:hypothetical protein CLF_111693 [Clonorchis sinensis]|uniref:Uncharacterized protein n=1 Tax=Clonorchis sinensis TaxID=79923 RepID=G7YV76_CLOSI|nr:hypothetical protein CLF_111693 [Clonorchis sinensis]